MREPSKSSHLREFHIRAEEEQNECVLPRHLKDIKIKQPFVHIQHAVASDEEFEDGQVLDKEIDDDKWPSDISDIEKKNQFTQEN